MFLFLFLLILGDNTHPFTFTGGKPGLFFNQREPEPGTLGGLGFTPPGGGNRGATGFFLFTRNGPLIILTLGGKLYPPKNTTFFLYILYIFICQLSRVPGFTFPGSRGPNPTTGPKGFTQPPNLTFFFPLFELYTFYPPLNLFVGDFYFHFLTLNRTYFLNPTRTGRVFKPLLFPFPPNFPTKKKPRAPLFFCPPLLSMSRNLGNPTNLLGPGDLKVPF